MHSELLDIFDETMTLIGTASRSETHRQGLWHQTFQCWIAARRPNGISLLLQKRHPGKDTFPELYDITSAGHLLAGETAEDGMRELEEELGIAAAFDELVPIGVIPVQLRYQSLIDREFCHVFLYACSLPLDRYKL
ncbi:MAG: hydrolase, partial [Paenibacillus sp.]|nr:hydrolase [Paenibacillus sp.]